MTADMTYLNELKELRGELDQSRKQIDILEKENRFLKMHPVFVQGLKGETLVVKRTGGELTSFAAQHDITMLDNTTVEVKFSKLNSPVRGGATRRWNWSKPLGYKDKGKSYDYLLLIGDKDWRFPSQYLDDSPFVYFLIHRNDVPSILTRGAVMGSNSQLTTNLAKATSPASTAIKNHMVPVEKIESLLEHAVPVKP
jgi:hypothetical protein